IPYRGNFWMIHRRDMSCDWTRNRIPPTNVWQMLKGAVVNRQTKIGTNAVFQYPDHGTGFGAIPTQMGQALPNVYLNHRATRIDVARRCVTFNGGEVEVPYDTLISTIPLPALIPLIPEAPAEVRDAARRL